MKTNRDEILRNCLSVFASVNYEKASITALSRACGLSRMGIHHYYPNKLAVFMAVADRYVFETQAPDAKFSAQDGPLLRFIGQYVRGVEQAMLRLTESCTGNMRGGDVSPNFYYFHFIVQVRLYYPGSAEKFTKLLLETRELWTRAVERAVETGELRPGTDVPGTARLFHEIHYGLSFEMAFFRGLDIDELHRQYLALYELVRA